MANKCLTPLPPGAAPAITDPNPRVLTSFTRRYNSAKQQATLPAAAHPTNGDSALPHQIATYTKCVKQDGKGIVNPAAYSTFTSAIAAGTFAAFEAVTLGGTRTLNGPMGSYAYTAYGADASQFHTAAPPSFTSPAYAVELVELYWCSLLRDVAFTDYATNPIAAAAANELNTSAFSSYKGPRNSHHHVTPALLFRGAFPGEADGPYVSQFFLTPTSLGAQAISQRYTTYLPDINYMTDEVTWEAVQNGVPTGFPNQTDPTPQYLHNGRGLAAFTHVDELYQSYFTAYLAMKTLNVPPNQGLPYVVSKTQNGFGTFGGPDIASTLAAVAKVALNAVWYQKWFVHLRHRPESGAGIVHYIKAHSMSYGAAPDPLVLSSHAVARSFERYGTYFLSQPFPEGSPAHPAYPTGHGTVGGACITILKFFYDGDYLLTDIKVPSPDGTALDPWTGEPGHLSVNGELAKLAHNVTFGHGLHGGIHWRSDSDESMRLGEAVAISFLEDLVCTYPEPFTITITLLDGTSTHTFTNP